MKPSHFALLAAILAALVWKSAQAETFPFALTSGDAAIAPLETVHSIQPRQIALAPTLPEGVKKVPSDLVAPRYGVFQMGPIGSRTTYAVMLEELDGKPPRLIVDANHNGDLTDDPHVTWRQSPYQSFDGKTTYTRYIGDIIVQVPYANTTLPLLLHFVRLDPRDPNFAATDNVLVYLPGYARAGKLKLGDDTYDATLFDLMATGDFRGNFSKTFSRTLLLIDVNHNGRIDLRGEIYDTTFPFNIKGVTYELNIPDPTGSTVEVVKSKQTVPEVLPPPDLSSGKPALPFTQQTMGGKPVHFPEDYKGKLVLLYFWASWCPHCQAQIPFVTQAYKTYHSRGLEILGVSMDRPNQNKELSEFLHANHMTWPQIYDGKYLLAEIAQLYFIQEVPTPLLIDGDTGKIIAPREDLLSEKLDQTLAKLFAQRTSVAEKK